MRPTIRWIAVLVFPALLLTGALVEAQKKPAEKDPDKTTDKMAKAGSIVGKIMNVYEDKKKVRIQVTFSVNKLNPSAVQQMASAQQNMAAATAARDRQGYINAQNSLLQARATLYTVESKSEEIEIQAIDDVVVRMAKPREDFDDKGKPKRYTKKELAELRGDDKKLPGYKAEFSDLTTEQMIQVTLVRKKGALPRPKKGKGKDDGAAADLLAEFAPQASLIMILREPASAAPKR